MDYNSSRHKCRHTETYHEAPFSCVPSPSDGRSVSALERSRKGLFCVPVDRQGASANGPAWAAPKKHRNPYTRGHTAERPFWQGPHKNHGQVVRQPIFRDECLPPGTLDSVQDTGVGRGKIAELVLGYHPWGNYVQMKHVKLEPCTDCYRAEGGTGWSQHNPACLECGGRYLRLIQQLRIPADEKRERLRAALRVWTDLGHSEDELRRLAARKGKA